MGNDRKIIEHYELKPHPEGGWFKRTYSSQEKIKLARGERICGSSILYYLSKGEKSRLHFLDSDEAWYFHLVRRLGYIFFTKGVIGQCYWETPLITKKSFNIQLRGVQYLVQNWRMIMVH